MDQVVRIDLTIAEVDFILNIMADRPFKEVHRILNKLQGQARAQVQPEPPTEVAG